MVQRQEQPWWAVIVLLAANTASRRITGESLW